MILAIETSAVTCAVGFYDGDKQLAEYIGSAPMKHSEQVGSFVEKGLKKTIKKIDLVAVAIGPGSFTGLRIGLSYAQGFCFGRNIPLVGVSNHQILAFQGNRSKKTYTVIDAHRQELYLARHKLNQSADIDSHKIIKATAIENELSPKSQLLFLDGTLSDIQIDKLNADGIICIKGEYKTSLLAELGNLEYSKGRLQNPEDLEPMYIRPFAGVK